MVHDVDHEGDDESCDIGRHLLAHHVPRRELEHPRPSHDGLVRLPARVHPPDHRERAVAEVSRREHQHQRRLVPLRHVEAHALRPSDFSRPLGRGRSSARRRRCRRPRRCRGGSCSPR
ncbi:unnamed protein product [Musa banksii]